MYRLVFAFSLLVCLWFLVPNAVAQEQVSFVYTSEHQQFSFRYPAGWSVFPFKDVVGSIFGVSSNATDSVFVFNLPATDLGAVARTIYTTEEDLAPGQVTVYIFYYEVDGELSFSERARSLNASLIDLGGRDAFRYVLTNETVTGQIRIEEKYYVPKNEMSSDGWFVEGSYLPQDEQVFSPIVQSIASSIAEPSAELILTENPQSTEQVDIVTTVNVDFEGRDFDLSFNTETCAIENGADFIIYEIMRFYGELGRITNPVAYSEHFITYFRVNEGSVEQQGRVEQLRQYVENRLSDIGPACTNQLHYLIGTRPVDMSSLGNISYGFFFSFATLRSAAGSPLDALPTLVEHVLADMDQRFNIETRIEIQESCNYVVSCVLRKWFLQGDFPGDRIEIQVGRALAEGFLLYNIPIDSSTLISLGNEFELSF